MLFLIIHRPQLEHRHYPTKIIQCKHTACLSSFPFFLYLNWLFFSSLSFLLSVLYFSLHFFIFFLLRVFSFPSFPPYHRCCGSSHPNPVSCPLNNSQVHTPCSCRDYTPTQTRSHGPERAHRARSKIMMGRRVFGTLQSGKITVIQFNIRLHISKSYKEIKTVCNPWSITDLMVQRLKGYSLFALYSSLRLIFSSCPEMRLFLFCVCPILKVKLGCYGLFGLATLHVILRVNSFTPGSENTFSLRHTLLKSCHFPSINMSP